MRIQSNSEQSICGFVSLLSLLEILQILGVCSVLCCYKSPDCRNSTLTMGTPTTKYNAYNF